MANDFAFTNYAEGAKDDSYIRLLRKLLDWRPNTVRVADDASHQTIRAFAEELSARNIPDEFTALIGSHSVPFELQIDILRSVVGTRGTYENLVLNKDAFKFPAKTGAIFLKGCNAGRSPAFLDAVHEAFLGPSSTALVFAPKFFLGLTELPGLGVVEYMIYGLTVRRKEPIIDRPTLIQAFASLGERRVDGTQISAAELEQWLPKGQVDSKLKSMAAGSAKALGGAKIDVDLPLRNPPLAVQIGGFKTAPIVNRWFPPRRLRLEYITTEVNGWRQKLFPVPAESERMVKLIAALKADPAMNGGFPHYEQQGYASVDDFVAGHTWKFDPTKLSDGRDALLCTPARFQYGLRTPILSPQTGSLIMNFYPNPTAPPAVRTLDIRQILESDATYYGTSTVRP
jgi:hypothetical protein